MNAINQTPTPRRTLKEFALEIHEKACDLGHCMLWNDSNPDKIVGTCDCGLVSEVIDDGRDTLTEQGELKRCRLMFR